ncbi:LacI family DNA-binding transcriptional regulator [Paenibacillus sp. sgz500958]|uniref:LacI family DNA-binding transcriptional regulator n=1 Tax=Paenibacillus sp. sgz500958 TaxID=3242475 RepID=UPI0036D27AFA
MKITIEDVARAANVAKSTVSKVINDSPKISVETKLKVRRIMSEMNYIPNDIATRLAKQSSRNIGLLIDMSKKDEFLNQFFYNIIGGIEAVLAPLGYELTISNVQSGSPDFMNRLVLSKRVDGLIANSSVLSAELAEELNRHQIPYISVGEIPAPANWVDFDNELGGEMLTQHLLSQGYHRIAFIGGKAEESIFLRRIAGYRTVLQRSGALIRPEWTVNGTADEHTGYQAAISLLQGEDQPDAMVCMSNFTAFGVLQAARELQVDIPGELGVAAFDDYPLSPYTSPPLTSLNIDTFKLGTAAGERLMEQMEAESQESRHLLLEPELITRESTCRHT